MRIWLLSLVALAACTPEQAENEAAATDPVVVQAVDADDAYLATLFAEFTAATGQIVLVSATEEPDVLLAPTAVVAWEAAEEGDLRPNYSPLVAASVPAWLRDPDQYWTALSYRNAILVYDAGQFAATDLPTYEALAAETFRRKLCLTMSALPINSAVIAQLMRKLGRRDAELAVRGWVANLAQPVFATEQQLLAALASGDCALGMLASGVALPEAGIALAIHVPDEHYADAEVIGIKRHARNPDGAAQLIDWLLQADVQTRHAASRSALAVVAAGEGDAALVHTATMHEEAQKLAERARYR